MPHKPLPRLRGSTRQPGGTIQIVLPKLHNAQQEVLQTWARFNILACG